MKKHGFVSILIVCCLIISLLSLTFAASAVSYDSYTPTLEAHLSTDRQTLTLTPTLITHDTNWEYFYSWFGVVLTFADGCTATITQTELGAALDTEVYDGTYTNLGVGTHSVTGAVPLVFSAGSDEPSVSSNASVTITLSGAPSNGAVATVSPMPAGAIEMGSGSAEMDWYVDILDFSGSTGEDEYYKTYTDITITGDGSVVLAGSAPAPSPVALEVGEGKDITNNTGTGEDAATVTGSVSNGTATLNVDCAKACVVAYTTNGGETYTRVNATAADSGYDFVVPDYSDSMKFVVAVKGDVSGDGDIDSDDFGPLVAAFLETGELSSLGRAVGDLDGNGVIDSDDFGPLVAAFLGTGEITW